MTDTSTKTRPILFSAPMVRAILEGRKTQTRRIIKCPPSTGAFALMGMSDGGWWPYKSIDGESLDDGTGCETPMNCPYGYTGDRLWVRETWAAHMGWDDIKPSDLAHDSDSNFWWAADRKGREGSAGIPDARRGKWRPSIFMPRWASRITLEIAEVRVERLREITCLDVLAEGSPYRIREYSDGEIGCVGATEWYRNLWETINGAGSWDLNPWVWAVSFKAVPR